MRSFAWMVLSLAVPGLLMACGSTIPSFQPPADTTANVTAGIAGTVAGKNIVLEQALITAQNRALGLALFDRTTDPDMADLAPDTWYVGVRFTYDAPGPELRTRLVNYGRGSGGRAGCVRLIHVDASGARHDVPVSEGTLEIRDWREHGGLIVEISGVIDLRTADGGRLAGSFLAPVQGSYPAP